MKAGPKPLRVFYVQPNSEVGGSDIALARSIEALRPQGVEAVVALPGDGPLVERLRAAGADVRFAPMRQLRTLPSPGYQARYLAGLPGSTRRLARLIRETRPDLVHTNSLYCLYGAFAARLAGAPHLWHVREIPPQLPVLTAAYARMTLALSTRVLAMTDACADGLFHAPHPRVLIAPDGLDAAGFAAGADGAAVRRALGVAPGQKLVGFVARLDPWKGAEVFVDACAELARRDPDCRFLIAGGAPAGFEAHEQALRARSKALGLDDRLSFLGWRYRLGEVAHVMAALDVFCHCSVAPEPFGLVLLEAMACGAVVVAARAGGPLTIIRDGETGLLTTPGDSQALADAVAGLLENPARRAALRQAASRDLTARFSNEAFARRMGEIYNCVINRVNLRQITQK